ncbi:MAG: glycosyltransferase, partial [Pyrinomonadaceae bacterium]|nr:glycosyltransferase [Pyrinomonadaceae bacterium]
LLRVLRSAHEDYPQVHWAFFCALGREGRLDDLARSLGAEVIYSKHEIGDKLRFVRSLHDVMKQGRYDILHCHHDVMSAAYLLASQGLPFQKRIVHVHNTSLSLPTPSRLKASLAREPMRQMCLRMADQIVGISKEALESMVGSGGIDSERHRVVHYAVDTEGFSRARVDREGFRRGLGLAPYAKVLLFVGRVVSYKNPFFVVDVLEQLVKTRSDVVAVFAGAGNQAEEVLEMARQKSLESRVRLLGFRDDVPALMANSDVLIWPSLEEPKEGLGLGIVEAQAAGLYILMSRSVPAEAIVVPELVEVLALGLGAEAWSLRVSQILDRPRPSRDHSRAEVESSSFSMAEGVRNIISLYDKAL